MKGSVPCLLRCMTEKGISVRTLKIPLSLSLARVIMCYNCANRMKREWCAVRNGIWGQRRQYWICVILDMPWWLCTPLTTELRSHRSESNLVSTLSSRSVRVAGKWSFSGYSACLMYTKPCQDP